jgi:ABC-type transport system involved in multi-copper enzyme maturation permease subunit
MTAVTQARRPGTPGAPNDIRLTNLRVLRSEWLKLRSLRSTWITLAVTVAFVVGLSALFCGVTAAHWSHETFLEKLAFDPTRTSLGGVFLAQLSIGVLGVLAVTGEYATGTARATFTAVPTRLPVLVAKLVIFAVVSVLVAVPSTFAGFWIGQAFLSSQHIQTTLSAPEVTRAVVGAGLYLTAVGVFGIALGWLVRHTAGAIATLFGILLILPLVVHFLPAQWADDIGTWLPSNAGQAVLTVGSSPLTSLGHWAGFGVLCGWVALTVIAAAILLPRRDV